MQEPEQILAEISQYLGDSRSNIQPHKKVLVTFGGTRESIDGVRFLTNTSTGRTGALLCSHLAESGFSVVALHAESAETPKNPDLTLHSFVTANDLDQLLRRELDTHNFDAVIHLAAVSDFELDRIESDGTSISPSSGQKIPSGEALSLHFRPARKLIGSIKKYSRNKNIKVIGFKLTKSTDELSRLEAVRRLFQNSPVDYVVHNDENQIDRKNGIHPFQLVDSAGQHQNVESVADLARRLKYLISNEVGGTL
jgi:phosphopantothenoylcysteine synthetase/decarboxylase